MKLQRILLLVLFLLSVLSLGYSQENIKEEIQKEIELLERELTDLETQNQNLKKELSLAKSELTQANNELTMLRDIFENQKRLIQTQGVQLNLLESAYKELNSLQKSSKLWETGENILWALAGYGISEIKNSD